MLDCIILYKSVSLNKTKNHPIVITINDAFLGFTGFEYTRLHGWAKGCTGNNRGILGLLAFPILMKWSDEE